MRRRVLVCGLALVVMLPAAGALWQVIATNRDEAAYPPPGELVASGEGGTRLHLQIQGPDHRERDPGTPVVVLDSGLPGFSGQWAWVQPAIAEFATVVSYDRPGMGWSDPMPAGDPVDTRVTARQLHAALGELGLPGPYVLVGHSYGGLTTRVFADEYPEEVSGLVLVDPSHPDQGSRLKSGDGAGSMWFMAPLARIGALRLALLTGVFDDRIGPLPQRQVDESAAFLARPELWAAANAELAGWDDTAQELHRAKPLGNLRLTVLTAGVGVVDGWLDLHEELVALSSRGSHRVVADATHLSLVTDPVDSRATVAAVRSMLAGQG